MAIKMRKYGDEVVGPAVYCDLCGEQIREAKDGNCLYPSESFNGSQTGMFFTHKACNHEFEQKLEREGHGRQLWTPLDLWALYLFNNLSIDQEQVQEHALTVAQL